MDFGKFIFGDTLEMAIEAIPEHDQLRYYRYIKDYGLHGIEPELSGFELSTWIQMKTLIDNTMPTRNNRRTGKNGAPFGNNNASKNRKNHEPETTETTQNNLKTTETTETTETTQNNLKTTETTLPNVNDNVNDNDNVNVNENENENENSAGSGFSFSPPKNNQNKTGPPSDKPIKSKDDAVTVWNKAREYWNERGLKPECRNIMMNASDIPEILRTFQHYSRDEIRNAIGNYAWHKFEAGSEYRPPPPYLSLAGFLKAGVEKYFDDDALDQQFREEKR